MASALADSKMIGNDRGSLPCRNRLSRKPADNIYCNGAHEMGVVIFFQVYTPRPGELVVTRHSCGSALGDFQAQNNHFPYNA